MQDPFPQEAATVSRGVPARNPPWGRLDQHTGHAHDPVSLELVLARAEEVLNESVPATFRDETLERLERSQLSESRKSLIFNDKLAFETQA